MDACQGPLRAESRSQANHVADVVEDKAANRDVVYVAVLARAFLASATTVIHGWLIAGGTGTVNRRCVVAAANTAPNQPSEDVYVFPLHMGGLAVMAAVLVQPVINLAAVCFREEGWVMLRAEDPLILRLEAERHIRFVAVVVAVRPTVERAAQDDGHGGRRPCVAAPRAPACLIEQAGRVGEGVCAQVGILELQRDLGFIVADREGIRLAVVGISKWHTAAIPFPLGGPGVHRRSDALARHVALELGKDQDDLEHGFAHRGRRIELLVLADERHAELLALGVHRREVQEITADAVNLPDEHMRELATLDALHHLLERWAVCILAGVPGILEDLVIFDIQNILGIVHHVLPLHRQGILVHLMNRGHAAVDCRLLCSWHRAASSRRPADVSMLIVAEPRAAMRTPMRAPSLYFL